MLGPFLHLGEASCFGSLWWSFSLLYGWCSMTELRRFLWFSFGVALSALMIVSCDDASAQTWAKGQVVKYTWCAATSGVLPSGDGSNNGCRDDGSVHAQAWNCGVPTASGRFANGQPAHKSRNASIG